MTSRKLTIAVTGAGGFTGAHLVTALAADGRFSVRACFRELPAQVPRLAAAFEIGDIAVGNRWSTALAGADIVLHTAGRAHRMTDTAADPLAEHRRVNVEGAARLARAAFDAGVRQLIFLSSIKVNGEATPPTRPFTADDDPAPQDAYSTSKREAEDALRAIARETGAGVTVLRMPLVYGPGAKGNLERLMRAAERSAALPIGHIDNRRSMLGVENLASAVIASALHPGALNRTYLLSDQHDLSTPQLFRLIAGAMDKRTRLLPVPVWVLRAAGAITGRMAEVDRLVGSLTVDSTPISNDLGWRPTVPPAEGIAAMVRAFLTSGRR